MRSHKTPLALLVCAGVVAMGAIVTREWATRSIAHQADRDMRKIAEILENSPPPHPRPAETGLISPYNVWTGYSITPSGGAEHASSSFIAADLGLEVKVSIHTCRPRILQNGVALEQREINLEDGSNEDLCTSGGVLQIVDTMRGETFNIGFKLLGAPQGTLGWNARQLVSTQGVEVSWRETLHNLREGLPRLDAPPIPPTVHMTDGLIETRGERPPHELLMVGDEAEMCRLFQFRSAFADFYQSPDEPTAQHVAWLLIDSLLESKTQQELSEQWIDHFDEAA